MHKTSAMLSRLSESATLAMAKRSRELKAQGKDVISLSLGEPDFPTPNFVKQAAIDAIHNNITHYTPVNGFEELRKAVSHKFKRDNNLDYSPNEIVVSTGAKQSLINTIISLVNEGDEVILFAPYWVSYIEMIKVVGGVPVELKAGIEQDFKVSAQQLKEAITDKTRLVIFSSPCNPTGSVYEEDELNEIAKVVLAKEELYVISDEIYEHINFTDAHCSIGAIAGMKDRTITVNGLSKGFAMTGWRLGYIGAPLWIANSCTKFQGQVTSGTNSVTQMAAIAALEADPKVTEPMKEAFLRRRNLVIKLLSEIPGMKVNEPQGAFYLFPDVSNFFGKSFEGQTINNASDLCEYLLMNALVSVVTGEAFGAPECFRISYATSDDILTEAITRIKTALAKLA